DGRCDVVVDGGGDDLRGDSGAHAGRRRRGRAYAVEVAVLSEQCGGGLDADARDAGHSVGVVAAHRGDAGVLLRDYAVLREYVSLGDDVEVAHAAGGVDDAHVAGVVDELEEIAVPGDDVHGDRRLGGERADDVVGLVRCDPDDRDAEG